ncbi:MAG: phosphotransferase, partial [Bacteroidales bacterium]|nr:phosphotransferase [Bacteroidales bacterium]
MSNITRIPELDELFRQWSGILPLKSVPLPESGSSRIYRRLSGNRKTVVGVFNPEVKENDAFIYLSKHFHDAGIPVPQVLLVNTAHTAYIQEDLGDITLFGLLRSENKPLTVNHPLIRTLEKIIRWLPLIQTRGHEKLDYSICYPRKEFDRQSMLWDLNYFKYNFLKLVAFRFDEQALEDDIQQLVEFLNQAPRSFFLYRDFQSANIMIREDEPWFIDFQGGRMGFPAYDLASLLFDAKARLSDSVRDHLYKLYVNEIVAIAGLRKSQFELYYPGFLIIRMLQALGAFGFRGLIEKKEEFLRSIPPAMDNLE